MEEKQQNWNTAILLIHCQDSKWINALVTNFIYKNNGNIIHLDQHVDEYENIFFMRIEWELHWFDIHPLEIKERFSKQVWNNFDMSRELFFSSYIPRMALFVSKESHCLFDILSRYKAWEWDVEIPLIISNHSNLQWVAENFGIPFYHIEVNKNNKKQQELKQIQLLKEYQIDFIVLARYMQILTSQLIEEYQNNIINIHHSFLPAFPGAKPYESAYKRGVKIVWATSHYVTEELDAGPIIEQDVIRVSHKDSIKDMVRKWKDIEKIVLSRAIYAHIKKKILVYNNRTVVFS